MDFPELARESQEVWEQNARWWDARMAEGDRWHTQLIGPATERLLAVQAGEHVVDLGCGNGWLVRRLVRSGTRALGCDFSPTLLECARARGANVAGAPETLAVSRCILGPTQKTWLASYGSPRQGAFSPTTPQRQAPATTGSRIVKHQPEGLHATMEGS